MPLIAGVTCEPMPLLTAQAFSKARRKVLPSAFKALNQHLQRLLDEAGVTHKTWRDLRVLAVDGSTCHLPLEPCQFRYFGAQLNETQPVARLSTLYDVLNLQVLDAAIGTMDTCERGYAQDHLAQVPANSLIIFDRGFPAYWLFNDLQQHGHAVLMRLPVNFNADVSRFRESSDEERLITLQARSARARAICVQSGVNPDTPVTLRLIRVILETGDTEILATSLLDSERYPACDFKSLYHLRWGVETDFRYLKQAHELQNFSGRTAHAVQQDLQAQILLKNLTSLFCSQAQPAIDQCKAGSKHRWKANYTGALSRMKNILVKLLLAPMAETITALIKAIARSLVPIIPGRSFTRKRRRPGTRGCEGYKRTM